MARARHAKGCLRGVLVVFLLTLACSRQPAMVSTPAPDEVVVLLPEPDGTVGSLSVRAGAAERTLAQPYAAVRTSPAGRMEVTTITAAEAQRIFGVALLARPVRPQTYTVYFAFGTDMLTESSTQTVQQILTEIAAYPMPQILVIGHTDRVGTERENDTLSLQRAERVRQDLIRRGIAADAIETVGRGERDATGDATRDRRVDIVVR